MEKTFFSVKYTVGHIVYQNYENNFIIFEARHIKFDEPDTEKELEKYIIKGYFDRIESGDTFKSNCAWVFDKKYGWQLSAQASFITIPSNSNGIIRFLKKFVKGIGKNTAEKIVKAYGVKTLDKIRESLDNLTNIQGIGKKKAERIRTQVLKYDGIEKLSVYLFSKGVTNFNDIVRIYEAAGDQALDKIMANPYSLCDFLTISKFPIADKIALNSGYSSEDPVRLSKIILFYLTNSSYTSGDMFCYFSDLCNNVKYFLKKNGIENTYFSIPALEKALIKLESLKEVTIDRTEDNYLIYLKSLHYIEFQTSELVRSLLESNTDRFVSFPSQEFFKTYTEKAGIISDKIQESAVLHAINNRFSILTGGPGTGKTQTIKEIIAALEFMNPDITINLCSPTGRAARRMSELTGREAFTLHRLLHLRGDDISDFDEDQILDADYIICDEASMIDAPLFYRLLKAVYDSNASLVLVGDKDQLPPVGAGMPFKDLIESGYVPTIKLENLFRQAKESQINMNANKILNGASDLSCDLEKQDFFFFPSDSAEQIQNMILRSIDGLIKVGESPDNIIVLSPMRQSSLGTNLLNEILQRHMNPGDGIKKEYKSSLFILREGDRVMQTRNNYSLTGHDAKSNEPVRIGVFNGDIGKITQIDNEEEEITVTFDDYIFVKTGKLVLTKTNFKYSFVEASDLTLAYATTVHKAQGSEFPCVIMPVNSNLVNLSRNIIYTAITRAKKRFVFVGDTSSLYDGISKTDNMHRNTRLKERICKDGINHLPNGILNYNERIDANETSFIDSRKAICYN